MHTITWRPGTDTLWDPLFDHLRERQYRDHEHPLSKNYNKDHFINECAALSIAFDENWMPYYCGSILKRDCWPEHTYRVVNRFWSVQHNPVPIKDYSIVGLELLKSQINWLRENERCDLLFISREAKYWQKWTVKQFEKNEINNFKFDGHKYLVCNSPTDDSCWQRIIYQGKEELLEQWSRK